jgi:hypothetical protein
MYVEELYQTFLTASSNKTLQSYKIKAFVWWWTVPLHAQILCLNFNKLNIINRRVAPFIVAIPIASLITVTVHKLT